MTRLRVNPAVEVLPHARGGLLLRLPLTNRTMPATPFEAGLLRAFDAGTTLEDALRQSPFQKDAARRFLEEARRLGFLVEEDGGKLRMPPLVDPVVRFCAAPAFDPEDPPGFVAVGVPWDKDTTGHPGARFGPAAIRGASEGVRFHLDPLTLEPVGFYDYAAGETLLKGVRIADAGDVVVAPGEPPQKVRGRLSDVIMSLKKTGAIPIVLGGDHSITRAVLAAYDEPLHVVHLDAHTDLGDASHGVELHHGNVMTVVLDELWHVEAVHQIGLRGVIDRAGHVGHPKARQLGIDALRARGVASFLAGVPEDASCFLSLDIDVADPAFAPSTGTPVPGGLFPHELKALVREIARARDFVGMDLVEVSEPHGPADGTAGLAVACILSFAQGMVDRLTAQHAAGVETDER